MSQDFSTLDLGELAGRVKELEEHVFKVRFQHATAQLQDSSKLGKARRDLARAKTALRAKELATKAG